MTEQQGTGPRLSRLRLSHFRSHLRADISLDGRPVAIYGRNGAGKTNILEAISLLSPGRGLRRASADEIGRRPEALGWKVRAEIVTPQGHRSVDTSWQPGEARRVLIDEKPAPQTALASLMRIVWLVPAQDRLWTEGAEGRRRFFDRIAMSFIPGHAEEVLAYEKAMRERNRLLRDGVSDPGWYSALEGQMARAGAAMRANRVAAIERLDAAQRDADTAFPAAELALEEGDGGPFDSESAIALALSGSRPRDLAAGRSLTGPHRADIAARYAAKGVAARDASTGEQKALLISLILANARALRQETGAAPLVLLDEVAAHLDAGRRASLFDEICALGAQAFLTGTGPELFSELADRAERLEVSETDGVSHVTHIGD